MDEVLAAFDAINLIYGKHSRAAGAIAEEYFGAESVIDKVLDYFGARTHEW